MEKLNSEYYETESINEILKVSKPYMINKGYKLNNIVKNSRDGGYVSYVKNNIELRYTFLPDYDIQIINQESILSLIKFFLLNKKNKTGGFSSIRNKMKTGHIESLTVFLEEAMQFNSRNGLF